MNKSIVLGIGNEILTDDGIGPKVVNKLKKYYPIDGVEYENMTLGGLEVLEYIQDYDTVIFVDAIKTAKGIPGSVYLYTPKNFKETLHLSNLHDISFLSALKLGKKVGLKIPETILIFAVEIVEDLIFNEDFTPPIKKRFPEIILEIKNRIDEILN